MFVDLRCAHVLVLVEGVAEVVAFFVQVQLLHHLDEVIHAGLAWGALGVRNVYAHPVLLRLHLSLHLSVCVRELLLFCF